MFLEYRGCLARAGQIAKLASNVVAAIVNQTLEKRLAHREREIGIRRAGALSAGGGMMKQDFQVGERPVVLPLSARPII